MKFAEHLSAHITPEWRKQYINYEEMKTMLYSAVELSPTPQAEPGTLERYFANFDETFFHYCENELIKINTFYSEKLAEATRKFAALRSELSSTLEAAPAERQRRRLAPRRALGPTRTLRALQLAFSEYYLSLVLLQNYQNLNFTGFRKILKKHDKLFNDDAGSIWREDKVEAAPFFSNKDIDRLISETETAVTQELEHGDRTRAMQRLRVPPLGHQSGPGTTFRVGLFSGFFITLTAAAIVCGIAKGWPESAAALRLFRGPFLLVLFLFLWAVNVYCWRAAGVNHVLIFELEARAHLGEAQAAALAATLGTAVAAAALAFIMRPPFLSPVVTIITLYVAVAAFLINPIRICHYQSRMWLLRVLGRIVLAPFFYVGFADFWVADQLNSLVPVFLDTQYAVCYVLSSGTECHGSQGWVGVCVALLPSWWRVLQCLRRYRDTKEPSPHLSNAAKYASCFLLLLFAELSASCRGSYGSWRECPWAWLWGVSGVVSAGAGYAWDVRRDWGLLEAGEPALLRQEMVYTSAMFYYLALVEDLILRLAWAVSVSLTSMNVPHADLIVTALAPLEVFRRFIWNFFRLENEHLNNCGKFRAVRDISVAPLAAGDQAAILRLMDQPDDA